MIDQQKRMLVKLSFGLDLPVISYHPTGSRYICNPAPTNTDEDWYVLLDSDDISNAMLYNLLQHEGWHTSGNEYDFREAGVNKPVSAKKGITNLIFIKNRVYYTRACAASVLAKQMNLLNKEERIALFRTVLYGEHLLINEVIP